MNTPYTTRLAGLLAAVLMTVVINGAMLWKFDAVAHESTMAHSGETPTVVTLHTVGAQKS